jgi:hypothetical protein
MATLFIIQLFIDVTLLSNDKNSFQLFIFTQLLLNYLYVYIHNVKIQLNIILNYIA